MNSFPSINLITVVIKSAKDKRFIIITTDKEIHLRKNHTPDIKYDAIEKADNGNIYAHHDISYLILKKRSNKKKRRTKKKNAEQKKNSTKGFLCPVSWKYPIVAIDGGATKIARVGISFSASGWWKINLYINIVNRITQNNVAIEKKNHSRYTGIN